MLNHLVKSASSRNTNRGDHFRLDRLHLELDCAVLVDEGARLRRRVVIDELEGLRRQDRVARAGDVDGGLGVGALGHAVAGPCRRSCEIGWFNGLVCLNLVYENA